jgi:Protein of unknown function (DUF3759)
MQAVQAYENHQKKSQQPIHHGTALELLAAFSVHCTLQRNLTCRERQLTIIFKKAYSRY